MNYTIYSWMQCSKWNTAELAIEKSYLSYNHRIRITIKTLMNSDLRKCRFKF
jgi:hypothetical protein